MTVIRALALTAAVGFPIVAAAQEASRPPVVVQPGAPGQPSHELRGGAKSTDAPAATPADIAFMQGMIHHHAQAIAMVDLVKTRTRRDDLQHFAQRLAISQQDEITMMRTWLKDHGAEVPMDHGHGMTMVGGQMMAPMPGMLTAEQMSALERAKGPEFDRLFLEGMIQHHAGALAMVETLLESPGAAQDSTIFDFITHVDADQRMEITRMQQMLKEMR
jgi:uncharacterized protein (DUF305 family)